MSAEVYITIKGAQTAPSDVLCAVPDPFVSWQFFDIGVNSGGHINWRGVQLGADGLLHHIPYFRDFILQTDPANDTVSQGPSVASWPATDPGKKWVDCVATADGRIIANDHLAHGRLIIDTTGGSAVLRTPQTVQGNDLAYGSQVRGGAIVGDTLYSTSYDTSPGATSVVRVMELTTETYAANISYENLRTGPFYTQNPAFADGASFGALCTDTYWGAIGFPGKTCGIPFGQERVLWVQHDANPASRVAYQGTDTLTGGEPLSTGNETPPNSYLAKYTGGTRSSLNGCGYSMPRHASAILKTDPSDESALEIPLPADYLALAKSAEYAADSRSLGSEEGPDGRIYGTLWQVPAILWVDPRTDQVGWIDMRPYLHLLGSTRNWFAYAKRVGNSIYYSPASAGVVAKMTIHSELHL